LYRIDATDARIAPVFADVVGDLRDLLVLVEVLASGVVLDAEMKPGDLVVLTGMSMARKRELTAVAEQLDETFYGVQYCWRVRQVHGRPTRRRATHAIVWQCHYL